HVDVAKLREGTDLTLKMLNQAMEKFDIHEVNPRGERFDPEKHEAMAVQESAAHDPNTVIHVVQKGYLLSDRLLRPALVIVSKPDHHRPSGAEIDEQA
ncbi:MAG: nucleotide exchange factor GrpE, partial [Nitrococcus sp.]|nr:nucleotide exchange factor GrpE [Nitrococcus sp.]